MIRRRRWSRLIWPLIVVVLLVWATAAVVKIRSGYSNATRARDLLSEFKDDNGGVLADLQPLTTSPDLTKAQLAEQHFSAAASDLRSGVVGPLRLLPVVGRQIRVAQTLADSGATLISAVTSTFDEVTSILDRVQAMPPEERSAMRATATEDLSRSLSTLASDIRGLDTGSAEGLIGSLWKARGEFIENRDSLLRALDEAIATMDGVHSFLSGPNTYVVLAANNSEMRAGSGMFLQVSSMDIADGLFEMGDFTASEKLLLQQPASPFDPDLDAVWGDLFPTAEWRNINLTPRFDLSGQVATEMWQALGNHEPDGAMALDIDAMQRLLEVVGPVEVDGPDGTPLSVDAQNVVQYLLLEQYRQRSDDGGLIDKDERRSSLGDVARAAFDALNGEDVRLADLLEAFIDMGRGRHLLVWSSDTTQQQAWEALGVSGELVEDDLLVSLINRGANKLDQFIEITAALSDDLTAATRSVSVSVDLTNAAPDGLPPYVAGSGAVPGLLPGDYKGYLALNLPRGAHSITVSGGEPLATAADGPTRLVLIDVVVRRSEKLSIDVDFAMDESWSSIRVLPSARIPPIRWHRGNDEWVDDRSHVVTLTETGG